MVKPLPNLKVAINGIIFLSNNRHKIFVGNCRVMQINYMVYIKHDKKVIVLNNVDRVIYKKGYIFFRALGRVKIIFNTRAFYKYFNIKVTSEMFDLTEIKNDALMSIMENIFNPNSKELRRYLNLLINILKIKITDKSISVKKNNYNLKFELKYIVRDKLKTINVI